MWTVMTQLTHVKEQSKWLTLGSTRLKALLGAKDNTLQLQQPHVQKAQGLERRFSCKEVLVELLSKRLCSAGFIHAAL
jgi:hypothetical protein